MAAKHLGTCYKLLQRFCFSGFSILGEVGFWLHGGGEFTGARDHQDSDCPSPAAALSAMNEGICQSYYSVLACIFSFKAAQLEERDTRNLIMMLLLVRFPLQCFQC